MTPKAGRRGMKTVLNKYQQFSVAHLVTYLCAYRERGEKDNIIDWEYLKEILHHCNLKELK